MKLGLVGYPVGHSLSPWIHERLMEQQNVSGTYELFETSPESFDSYIETLKKEGLDGFNVTVPYKETIIPHLTDLDDSARVLGAVNTVKQTERGWIGYNTDGIGFVDSIKNRFPERLHNEAQILMLGSGGAARGIYHALIQSGVARVDVANRTPAKAEALLEMNDTMVKSKALDLQEAEEDLARYDVVIQTTSVGMSPNHNQAIISLKRLKPGAVVSDIVYRPMETAFLIDAKAQGASLHYGHEMLLQQAVYAFKIWTGTNPDAFKLLDEFESKLKGV
ncbi:shikimate dehydrogenase [Halobacillus locisalis]|uniref:Shikimate dehydrogenase (NADP(+)) n=1 Tax=Halobacillus locisalis TaxID=220753 RepID=A0A838CNP2_9BACI|nr:shikimate dehydrogenase [Halobacillus locisalis]MBA2173523.1 shikimate dehydrogenase [Halobacillus locisalis]